MKARFDPGMDRLELAFESRRQAEEFAAGVGRDLGFMVRLDHRLALHHPVRISLAVEPDADEGSQGEITARVAQVFERTPGDLATAFLVEDPDAVGRWLSGSGGLEGPGETDSEAVGSEEESSGEMRGTSPIHRIKQMNPKQRAMLALKAGRTERRILLRDNTPQVLLNLLNNPHIDGEEVLQIARSSHAVAPILQRVASDARWNANQEIVAAVVRHPRTPSQVATRLLPGLRTADLRTMARMSTGLKETLRKAALREYMRRTGQRI